MAVRIWVILMTSFIIYSGLVYINCDKKSKIEIPDKHVSSGWKLWQEKNCQSCHQFYGLGGYMGPDLTNVISEQNKGAKYAHTIIKFGTGRMPNFGFSDSEVNDIVSFLTWIDKSGKSKVPDSAVQWSGSYNISN